MSSSAGNAKVVSLPARLLGRVVCIVAARPRLALWVALMSVCASVGVIYSSLTIRTDRSDLLDPTAQFVKSWKSCSSIFGPTSDLIVAVETPTSNPERIRRVLDDLAERVSREPEAFANVLYRIDQRALRSKGLQLLTTAELQATSRRVDGYVNVVNTKRWDLIQPDSLAAQLRGRVERAEASGDRNDGAYEYSLRYASSLNQFFAKATANDATTSANFRSPLPELIRVEAAAGAEDRGIAYLINAEGTVGLLQVQPVNTEADIRRNARSIARIRELISGVQAELNETDANIRVALTGIAVLDHDELVASQSDTQMAVLVALTLVGVLMFVGFRSIHHPMLAFLTLVVALTWTTAAAALAIGHLNILSISFVVILTGLGVDFSIHFLSRYLHLRQELYELPDALRLTAEGTGTAIMTSAVTTALAFGSAMLTGFPGLAELGMIAAIGILLCAAATFLFLPALIAFADANVDVDQLPQPRSMATYRRLAVAWPLSGIAVALVVIGGLASQAFELEDGRPHIKLAYDSNLMNLHDKSLESVKAVQRLHQSTGESLLFAVSVCDSREQAMQRRREFLALPSVARVTDVASQLPDPPDMDQQAVIRQMQQKIAAVPRNVPSLSSPDVRKAGHEIEEMFFVLRDSKHPVAKQAAGQLDQFLDKLAALPPAQATAMLDAYQTQIAGALFREFGQVSTATLDPVRPEDLPIELRTRYYQRDDAGEHWLLRIHPKKQVWDDRPLAEFVQQIRTIDADVTGIPIRNYESAGLLHHSYRNVAVYSLSIIAVILLFGFLRPGQKLITIVPPLAVVGVIGYTMFKRTQTVDIQQLVMISLALTGFIAAVLDYRNLRDTLLALLPPLGGGAMMLGAMALLNLDFNPVNLIVLPLVLGIGVDNGIHMVQDYRRQVADGAAEYSPSSDSMNGMLITSLTSIVGFGSLAVASHRGLFSLGILMALGASGCLFVCLTLMPPLLALVTRYQPASQEPVRLRQPGTKTDEAGDAGEKPARDTENRSQKQQQKQEQRRAA